MKIKTSIIYFIVALIIGFLVGRIGLKSTPEIKYIKGDTVVDTVYQPKLIKEEITKYVKLPGKIDTVNIKGDTVFVETSEIDTARIIADYIIKRTYEEELFNNDIEGELKIQAIVQYNTLNDLSYEFTPVLKEIKTINEPLFTPFIVGSYNTQNYLGLGGGIMIKQTGAYVKYINNPFLTITGWEFGVIKTF